MLDSYIFVHKETLDEIEGCGMKLSQWADRRVTVKGVEMMFISSYLNPRDNMVKYKSSQYKIVKLEVDMEHCFVAEAFLSGQDLHSFNNQVLYAQTIIPAKNYVYGMYRQPECLIAKTILPNEMRISGNTLSFPLFYENSESLYLNKLMQYLKEENPCFEDVVLYYYFDSLVRVGKAEKLMDENAGLVAFTFMDGRKPVILALPEQEVLVEGQVT